MSFPVLLLGGDVAAAPQPPVGGHLRVLLRHAAFRALFALSAVLSLAAVLFTRRQLDAGQAARLAS